MTLSRKLTLLSAVLSLGLFAAGAMIVPQAPVAAGTVSAGVLRVHPPVDAVQGIVAAC